MICKKCGKTVSDGAVFCPICGGRADGKVTCPKCSHPNDGEYVFCEKCGKRLDGKVVCECGALLDANAKFCVKCGKGHGEERPRREVAKANDGCACDTNKPAGKAFEILRVVFRHTITGLFLLALVLLFVACFTPLFTMKDMDFEGTNQFHYFFGKVYTEYFDLPTEARLNSQLFAAFVTTALIVANLATTAVALTIGLVKGIKSFITNKDSKIAKYVGMSFASTLALVVWVAASWAFDKEIKVGALYIVALILAAVFLFINLGFNIALNIKSFVKPANIACLAINVATVVFALIAVLALKGTAYKVPDIDAIMSFPGLYGLVDLSHFSAVQAEVDSPYALEVALSLIQVLLFVAAAIIISQFIGCLLASVSENRYEKAKQPGKLILAIFATALVVGLLVLNIMLVGSDDLEGLKNGPAVILALVFVILALATSITSKVMANALKRK